MSLPMGLFVFVMLTCIFFCSSMIIKLFVSPRLSSVATSTVQDAVSMRQYVQANSSWDDIKRRLTISAIVSFVMTALMALVPMFLSAEESPPLEVDPTPSVHIDPMQDTSIQLIEKTLGDFMQVVIDTSNPTPETHAPNILRLNQNDTTYVSVAWTIPSEHASWTAGEAIKIQRQSIRQGYVTFSDNGRHNYIVKILQPFFFEDWTSEMFMIDIQGRVWSMTMPMALNSILPSAI